MKIPLLCFFENFLLTAGDVPGRGALSHRLLALRYWAASKNQPMR